MEMQSRKIYIAGHRGMVGSAVCRRLATEPGVETVTRDRSTLDLTDAAAVEAFFACHRPDAVIFAAAKVGGILANATYPAEFLTDNALMALHAVRAAHRYGVERFLFLGSTCIYPRDAAQPLSESALLSGPLEETNEAYALAKIAGVKLCQYYRREHGVVYHSAMPCNLYGPGDNYHPEHSHVLPALLYRFHEARQRGARSVILWGSGAPRREFLHVDDLADAIVHLLNLADPPDWINVGTGADLTVLELAKQIAEVVGFDGRIELDPSKPDGTPRKLSDVSLLHSTGWRHRIDLRTGLERTYEAFLRELSDGRIRARASSFSTNSTDQLPFFVA